MAVRIVINEMSVSKFVQTNPVMQRALLTAGERVMDSAKANSPFGMSRHWGPYKGVHGYYQRRFKLLPYRGGFRLWNMDPFAHLVEWGSANNSVYAPIRRAVASSGLRFKPNPEPTAHQAANAR